jgi:hypothetical protein
MRYSIANLLLLTALAGALLVSARALWFAAFEIESAVRYGHIADSVRAMAALLAIALVWYAIDAINGLFNRAKRLHDSEGE